jgi:hypothetical protein
MAPFARQARRPGQREQKPGRRVEEAAVGAEEDAPEGVRLRRPQAHEDAHVAVFLDREFVGQGEGAAESEQVIEAKRECGHRHAAD